VFQSRAGLFAKQRRLAAVSDVDLDIPRGRVTLSAAFDRAAYMAGETAGIRASINNESEQDVQKMSVKLVRTITLRDSVGNCKVIGDVMCRANYPGVEKKSAAPRDMPHTCSGVAPPVDTSLASSGKRSSHAASAAASPAESRREVGV
jgi:hypothetical protein